MNAIKFEWTKFRTLRSSWVTAVSVVFSAVALSLLGVSDVLDTAPQDLPDGWDPTAVSFDGFLFAQLVIGMLGALAMAPEFASGMIGSSLSVVPSRRRFLAAKTIVVSGVAAGTALIATLTSFSAVQLALGDAALPHASLGDPGVLRALAGACVYLTLVALVGLAVGVLARSTASSLAALVGALLLAPALGPGLPGVLGDWFERYWPITAGQQGYTTLQAVGSVGPGLGLLLLAGSAVVSLAAAHGALHTRDV